MKKDYAQEGEQEESLGISRASHGYYAEKTRRWRNHVGLVVLLVVFSFWGYTLLFTPFFNVQSIVIDGLSRIPQDEIQQRLNNFLQSAEWGIVPRNNIFIVQKKRLKNLFQWDARIAALDVQKNYTNRSLSVTIKERVPEYIAILSDKAFAIDKDGVALIALSLPPPKTLPSITDLRPNDTTLGQKVFRGNELSLFDFFRNQTPHLIQFTDARVGEPSIDALTLTIEEGWALYLSLADRPEVQFERLKVLLATKIKPERRKKLQYIDLRFGERTYYR